jgi:hypothetical protein
LIQAQLQGLHLLQVQLAVGHPCRRLLSPLALPPSHPPLLLQATLLQQHPIHHYSLEQMCHFSAHHFPSCLSVSI